MEQNIKIKETDLPTDLPTDVDVVKAVLILKKYTNNIDEIKEDKCNGCVLNKIKIIDDDNQFVSICDALSGCFDGLSCPEHLFRAAIASPEKHVEITKTYDKIYKQACEDMWDFVKAITLPRNEYPNAITIHEMKQIYGAILSAKNIIQHFDGHEALRNYQDWKRNCIVVGDEVIDDDGDRGIVVWVSESDNEDFDMLLEGGSFLNSYDSIYDDMVLTKTGRNFKDQVDALKKCFDKQEDK